MTLITVNCTDQTLTVTSRPQIASGGVNEDRMEFSFCAKWDEYIKTAIFYRTQDEVYHVLLDENNTCVIPKEVLATPGTLYFGVFGVNGDATRTSEIQTYIVSQGAITESTAVSDPTPNIYVQLLNAMGDLNKLATADKSSLVSAINEVYRTGGGIPVVYTSGDGKMYEAEIEGVKSYSDIPMIIMVPHVNSAAVTPSLLIKGLSGAAIRRNNTYQTGNSYTESGATATWLTANTPVLLLWNGRSWIALSQSMTYGGDIDGTIPVRSGGTGRNTLDSGSYLVGNGTGAVNLKTPDEVREDIGAAKVVDGAVISSGSDYADCFSWSDGNPDKEDRTNRFVQLADGGSKIAFATSDADICGVTTDTAAFVGNYDISSEYTSMVGILGVVTVIDNGTCAVGETCMSDDNGYAVPSTNNMGYRVMERLDENKIRIAVKPNDDMVQRIKRDMDKKVDFGKPQDLTKDQKVQARDNIDAASKDDISSLSGKIDDIPSGKDGADGQDGITPTIGDNGNWYLGDTDTGKPSRGETGPAGSDGKDGASGADGHTPVKGTDYWTAEDQQAIVSDVLAALPTWEGGSY